VSAFVVFLVISYLVLVRIALKGNEMNYKNCGMCWEWETQPERRCSDCPTFPKAEKAEDTEGDDPPVEQELC